MGPCQAGCECPVPMCVAVLFAHTEQAGQLCVPFPAGCMHGTGQLACGLAWLWEAAGSCV